MGIVIKAPSKYVTRKEDSQLTSNNPKRYTPVCWEPWEADLITIDYSKTWEKDISRYPKGSETRRKIKSLIDDLKNGYLYTDSLRNKDSDTHVLKDFCTRKSVVWSKTVTGLDRLTYSISEPTTISNPDGTIGVQFRVVILSCMSHKIGESPDKQYSEKEN